MKKEKKRRKQVGQSQQGCVPITCSASQVIIAYVYIILTLATDIDSYYAHKACARVNAVSHRTVPYHTIPSCAPVFWIV